MIEEFEITNNEVLGVLSVNTSFEYEIDYEKYEVVYLAISVEDENQDILPNTEAGILVVRILDENDNAPQFIGDTLTVPRRVFEEAPIETLIGSILAEDIDGPEFSIIQYSIT